MYKNIINIFIGGTSCCFNFGNLTFLTLIIGILIWWYQATIYEFIHNTTIKEGLKMYLFHGPKADWSDECGVLFLLMMNHCPSTQNKLLYDISRVSCQKGPICHA